jgi:predicted DNA-binding transcriptional regulator AlpA
MALIPASIRSADGKGKSRVFLRRAAVCKRTGLPSSTLYRYIALGHFPRPYRLGPNAGAVAWLISDVDAWCASRPQVGGRDHG